MPGGPQEEDREPLVEVTPPEGIPIGSRLVMRRFGTEVGIFAGSMAMFSFNVNDKVGRDLAIATLSRTGLAESRRLSACTATRWAGWPRRLRREASQPCCLPAPRHRFAPP